MRAERIIPERRPPSVSPRTFVIYEKKSGRIRGVHQVFSGPPAADAVLTPRKQVRAANALADSLMQRTASTSDVPTASLAVLELKTPMRGGPETMRVDSRRRRLVPVRPEAGAAPSNLIRPADRRTP